MKTVNPLEILSFLQNNGDKTLTEIKNHLNEDLKKPVVLYHLRRLLDAGKITRDGMKYSFFNNNQINLIKVPFFGEFKAGMDAKFRDNENPDSFVALKPNDIKGYKPQDLFVVSVSGDSMTPTLQDGNMLLCKKVDGEKPQDEEIGLFRVFGEELKIKRFKKIGGKSVLWSDNFNNYHPIPIDNQLTYIGKMISVIG